VAVVNVTDDDVSGVRLAPVPLITISGQISFDDQSAARSLNPSMIRVVARAVNPDDFAGIGVGTGGPSRPVKDDFTFELKTAPGRIGLIAIVQPADAANTWRLNAIHVNGADVTDSGFEVGSQPVGGVDIEMTNRLQRIAGKVTDARGEAVKDYIVALFSQDRAKWKVNRYFAIGRPADDGGFTVSTLPPGEFYAIALDGLSADWEDPETLERLSRQASTVVLTPGETRALDLRLISLP